MTTPGCRCGPPERSPSAASWRRPVRRAGPRNCAAAPSGPGGRRWRSDSCAESSATSVKVMADMIEKFYKGKLEEAECLALKMVQGTYGIAVISADEPGKLVGARMGSPLVVGLNGGENFLASDVAALLAHTKKVVYLDDGE